MALQKMPILRPRSTSKFSCSPVEIIYETDALQTCIFCPSTDGAFKQTNSSRWAHLLCSLNIPEVTVANTTFMEPITDVEKVPKQRWKLVSSSILLSSTRILIEA